MKKTLFLLLLVFLVFSIFSQTKTKDEYLQSSTSLKTAGWVLVGVGTVHQSNFNGGWCSSYHSMHSIIRYGKKPKTEGGKNWL
jgi:hypothetical protein